MTKNVSSKDGNKNIQRTQEEDERKEKECVFYNGEITGNTGPVSFWSVSMLSVLLGPLGPLPHACQHSKHTVALWPHSIMTSHKL